MVDYEFAVVTPIRLISQTSIIPFEFFTAKRAIHILDIAIEFFKVYKLQVTHFYTSEPNWLAQKKRER